MSYVKTCQKSVSRSSLHLELPIYPIDTDDNPSIFPRWNASGMDIPAPSSNTPNSPVLDMTFSRKGDLLGLAFMDGTAQIFNLRSFHRRRQSFFFSSSKSTTNSVAISHSQELTLTASGDGMAHIFTLGVAHNVPGNVPSHRSTPVLSIDLLAPIGPVSPTTGLSGKRRSGWKSAPTSFTASMSANAQAPSSSMAVSAAFFYLDKFVLTAYRNQLSMHTYLVEPLDEHALIRHNYNPSSSSKSVKKASASPSPQSTTQTVHVWRHDHAQQVTAFACLNGTLSPLVLTACSDRSLALLDAAQGSFMRVVPDAHARPVRSLAVPQASHFVSSSALSPCALDFFATTATDNTASLWDLRAGAAKVASFVDHVNRREKVGVAFSPCMRFLGVGSEDGNAYMYDLRKGREVVHTTMRAGFDHVEACDVDEGEERVENEQQCALAWAQEEEVKGLPPPHTDVVSCVAFNPLKPELATASFDGGVRFHEPGARELRGRQ